MKKAILLATLLLPSCGIMQVQQINAEAQSLDHGTETEQQLRSKVYNLNLTDVRFRDGGFAEPSILFGHKVNAAVLSAYYNQRPVDTLWTGTLVSLSASPNWKGSIAVNYNTRRKSWLNMGRELTLVTPDGQRSSPDSPSTDVYRGYVTERSAFVLPVSVVRDAREGKDFVFQIAGDARGPGFATYRMLAEQLVGFADAYEKQFGQPIDG